MPSHTSQTAPTPRRPRGASLLGGLVLSLAVAGCQGGSPGTPVMVLGSETQGVPAPQFQYQPDARGAGDTFFTLALPAEAPLPKETVKVTGAAGSFNTKLAASTTPVITNVIPNEKGFILEGAKLDKGGLTFLMGAVPLIVSKKQGHQLVLTLPATAAKSGILTVKDNGVQILRISADARSVYVSGRVVVKFAEGASRTAVEKALQTAGITHYRYPGMNFVVAYYPPDQVFDVVKIKLETQKPVLLSVTRDTLFKGQAVTVNDPSFKDQWALPMINAPTGWQYATGGPDAVVAILDTGVALTHSDLKNNLYRNTAEIAGNGRDDDGNGRVDDVNGWNSYDQTGNVADDHGHGTEMAGIIAASADNAVGIAGVAYNTRFMPVKVMNGEGLASSSTLIDGINYAVRNRASVINLSLGSLIDDPAVKAAVEFAISFNVSVIAAMGNDSAKIKEYPAAWSTATGLIAVGATNNVDVRPNWSTWGEWMTVSAPGEGIMTTSTSGYTVASGTSHAAAHVSGYAAVIKAAKPAFTPAMIREMITSTATDRGTQGFDSYYGHGRINMVAALGNMLGDLDLEASSEHFTGNYPVERADDKNSETFWSSARRYQDAKEWLTADAGKVVNMTSVALLSAPYYSFLFPADFSIELSLDGKTWTSVASASDFEIEESTWQRWNFKSTPARYARLNITRSRTNPDNGLFYDQIAEIALNGQENAIIRNSSSNYYGWAYPTVNLTDKKPSTYWVSANRKVMRPEFAIADLGVSQAIKSIDLLSPPRIISEAFPKSVAFYVSNDKVNWTFVKEAKNITAAPDAWYKFTTPTITGRYIRLDVIETNEAISHGSLFGGRELRGFTAAVAEVTINR